jgi:hypothetical protein
MARSAWFDCVIFTVIIANTVTMASLNMRDPEAQNADGMAEHDTVRGGGAGEDRGPRVLVRAGHVHGQRVEPV